MSARGEQAAGNAQAQAAMAAQLQNRNLGFLGAREIGERGNLAMDALGQGVQGQLQHLLDAESLLGSRLDIGDQALSRAANALLGGGGLSDLVEQDPGLQFQKQQGELAAQRAAAASGNYGSGGYMKELSRYNQGLASQGVDNALSRLGSLIDIGNQAQAQQIGLRQAMGDVYGNYGTNLANLQTGIGSGIANALSNIAAQGVPLQQMQSQAQGMAAGAAGKSFNNIASLVGSIYGGRAFGGAAGAGAGAAGAGSGLGDFSSLGNMKLTPPNFIK